MGASSLLIKLTGGPVTVDLIEKYRSLNALLTTALNNFNTIAGADASNRYYNALLATEPLLERFVQPPITPAQMWENGQKKSIEYNAAARTLLNLTKAETLTNARLRVVRFANVLQDYERQAEAELAIGDSLALLCWEYQNSTKEDPRTASTAADRNFKTLQSMIAEYGWEDHLAFSWDSKAPSTILLA